MRKSSGQPEKSKHSKKLPCGRVKLDAPKSHQDNELLLIEMKERLNSHVVNKKLNRSEVREKILETIVKEAHHFRPQDLLERLKTAHPDVGRATLYRCLPVLVESGVIQEGPSDSDGQTLYELSTDELHHDHILCLDCGEIYEFHDDSIEKRQELVSKKLGFTPVEHRHMIYAQCDYLKR